ncbi:MAG: hypothetical protein K2X71_11610 [Methylobacterium sp.]|uniref:hypothetical protein n=1 Tax=Methylobacterium sp. TaxID=409 RepID=UPI0025879913|nr:hypothetical protein [Methylobacterium sp.]MBY0296673.1 hypothetical protein [Methylobacterium sp.]
MTESSMRRLNRRLAKASSQVRREYGLFLEGADAIWTACLGWVAIRTARLLLS